MSDRQPPPGGDAPATADRTTLDPVPDRKRTEPPADESGRARRILRRLLIPVLSVFTALVFGALIIILSDAELVALWTTDPLAALAGSLGAVADAYGALFAGGLGSPQTYLDAFASGDAARITGAFRPVSESLLAATPLIFTGLAVALGFRSGLFNIGAEGQLYIGATLATWIGFSFVGLPLWIHLPLAILGGFVGGAMWGFIPGFLKARTGAHEVIVTIMLNYIAFYLVSFLLRTPGALQAPDQNNPKSGPILESAQFPALLGDQYNLNLGFILVIVATIYVWYLLNRSAMGFRFRAVGENPNAARVAGIKVERVYVQVMLIAGALVGLAGVYQVLGNFTGGFAAGLDAGIGFDAITVALLGRSKPVGVFFAGILFGGLKAGSYTMQASEGIPVDIVLVVQSFIVLFIAAPPLVRAIFRLPTPDPLFQWRTPKTAAKAEVTK